MTKYIILLLYLFSLSCHGLSLNGTWHEDRDKSLQWNSANLKIDSEYLEKIYAISGHMYITYNNGHMCQFFEPYTMKYKEKVKEVERLATITAKFKIIEKNTYGFVLKTSYQNKNESIDLLVFESPESFYGVSLTTEDYGHPGMRTYFKRVEAVSWNNGCQ